MITRPDTRPIPVADGWAGAEMRVSTLSNLITMTDGRTNGPTDRRTDKASCRVACPQLERHEFCKYRKHRKIFAKYEMVIGDRCSRFGRKVINELDKVN